MYMLKLSVAFYLDISSEISATTSSEIWNFSAISNLVNCPFYNSLIISNVSLIPIDFHSVRLTALPSNNYSISNSISITRSASYTLTGNKHFNVWNIWFDKAELFVAVSKRSKQLRLLVPGTKLQYDVNMALLFDKINSTEGITFISSTFFMMAEIKFSFLKPASWLICISLMPFSNFTFFLMPNS